MSESILIPDIGDFKDVEVIDVLVKPGDTIALETPLLTIETEKATMDVPSSVAGVVKSVAIKKGDRVSKGSLVLEVEAGASAAAPAAKAEPVPAPAIETRDSGRETRQAKAEAPAPKTEPREDGLRTASVSASEPSAYSLAPRASYDFDVEVIRGSRR